MFNVEDPINSCRTEPDVDSYLSGCSHTKTPQWLKERPTDISGVNGTLRTPTNSHVIEYILYRRNSPFIDLALAQFERSKTTLQRIYIKYLGRLNLVAYSNPSLFFDNRVGTPEFDEGNNLNVWDIIHPGDIGKVQIIYKNTGLPSEFYSALVSSWEGDEESTKEGRGIHSDRFLLILGFLANNPRTSTLREESTEWHYLLLAFISKIIKPLVFQYAFRKYLDSKLVVSAFYRFCSTHAAA